ncbi:MAG: hypothetical protein D6790_04055, partial [Caldilineae bacterium]
MAIIAYLIPLIGPLFILLARRNDVLARYHARQSLGLLAVVIIAPLAWLVAAYAVAALPYGGMIAAFLFTLVAAAWMAAIVAWIAG